MDEFELFRAQAYSGGMSSSPTSAAAAAAAERSSKYLHDNIPGSASARRRRHSSVALGQDSSTIAEVDSSHLRHQARDRRNRLLANASGHHQSLDHGGSYDPRDAVVANVTVAVEPPSPTETRRQFNLASLSSSSTPSSGAAAVAAETECRDDVNDDYHFADNVAKPGAKQRPKKSPLCRRVTSPEAVLRSSPQPEVNSDVVAESKTQTVVEEYPELVANGQSYNIQPYLLPLPGVSGSSSSQQLRRSSMCSTSQSLQPVSESGGSPRRSSCTGLVQSSSSVPLTPPRATSRRNSAVTYLPDMFPPGRTRSDH